MKAGIYRTPNGNLIYVAKDRTIKAASLKPSTWPGMKVSHRSSDDTVAFLDYRATRWADVPNGCTDPWKALDDAQAANRAELEEIFGQTDDGGDITAQVEAIKRAEDPFSASLREHIVQSDRAEMAVETMVENAKAQGYTQGVHDELISTSGKPDFLQSADRRYGVIDKEFDLREVYKANGYRICHAASARKHIRQGYPVIGLGNGVYAWKPSSATQ